MATQFLTREEVRRIHADLIEEHGGTLGVRDPGLLDSALSMPAAGFGGECLHADDFERAAAYLFHLVKNHPFVDGNKRVGLGAADLFRSVCRHND
jgi:death-on-curing protein